jgi:hypothetical protein
VDQAVYYSQLEQGARYLASTSADQAERRTHLGWANRYYRLSIEARLDASASQLRAA